MEEIDVSRRRFTFLAGTLAAGQFSLQGASAPTAQNIAERIQASLGGEWPEAGPDGFKGHGHYGCSEAGIKGRHKSGYHV
jgi:hypothetical protein